MVDKCLLCDGEDGFDLVGIGGVFIFNYLYYLVSDFLIEGFLF